MTDQRKQQQQQVLFPLVGLVEVAEETGRENALESAPQRVPGSVQELERALNDALALHSDHLSRSAAEPFSPSSASSAGGARSVARSRSRRSSGYKAQQHDGGLVADKEYFCVSLAWVQELGNRLMGAQMNPEMYLRKSWSPRASEDFLLPVDNSALVERYMSWGVLLRAGLREEEHYRLVEASTWRSLMELFGGGPEISGRAVLDRSGRIVVDVCGVTMHVVALREGNGSKGGSASAHPPSVVQPTGYSVANFSRYSRVGDVLSELCRRMRLDAEQSRLWDLYGGRPHALCDPDATLADLELQPRQLVLIEQRAADGRWLVDDTSLPAVPGGREPHDDMEEEGEDQDEHEGRAAPGLLGLYNLRNTCYMNSTLQCMSNIPQLRDFFLSGKFSADVNGSNPLGSGGKLAGAFGELMRRMWLKNNASASLVKSSGKALSPAKFKAALDAFKPDFAGYLQQDSQELLGCLLDGLHEDLNRVKAKPVTNAVEAAGRPAAQVAIEALATFRARNDSHLADLFLGMLMSQVVCPRTGCDNVSLTFDPYMMLPLPVEDGPHRSQAVRVWLLPHKNPFARRELTVKVPAEGLLLHLRTAVARQAQLDLKRLILMEVSHGMIIRVINEAGRVDSISPDTQILALEHPRAHEHLEMLHSDCLRWARPLLSKTAGRLLVAENHLDAPSLPRNIDADDEPSGLYDFLKLTEQRQGDKGASSPVSIQVQPEQQQQYQQQPAEENSQQQARRKSVASAGAGAGADAAQQHHQHQQADGCPFQPGQLWVGSLEQTQYPHTRHAVRIEVAHCMTGATAGSFFVFMVLDISRVLLGNRTEQETRLLVCRYTADGASLGLALAPPPRAKSGSVGGASQPATSKISNSASNSLAQTWTSKMSPKSVTKALFGSLAPRRKPSLDTGVGASASSRFSFDRPPVPMAAASAPGAVAPPAVAGATTPSERPVLEERVAGRMTIEALPWRCSFNLNDEPSFLARMRAFSATGAVDVSGQVAYGKVAPGGGFQVAMDLVVRLASDAQRAQHLDSRDLAPADRKLALNRSRAVRYVCAVVEGGGGTPLTAAAASPAPASVSTPATTPLSARDSRGESEDARSALSVGMSSSEASALALDPGLLIVDKDCTEGQLLEAVAEHFGAAYNSAVGHIERGKARELKLPARLTRDALLQHVRVVRAGKNYACENDPARASAGGRVGRALLPGSQEAFFVTKTTFLRLAVRWDAASPVLRLFEALHGTAPLPSSTGNTNLQLYDCLDLFCKPETLSQMDSWYCSKCKQHQEAIKTLSIWSLPPVLVLNLKRFSQESESYTHKVERQVDFPLEGLDLRRYARDEATNDHALYDLVAVSSHYGGLGSGHYTAFARNDIDGNWYEFDDETVTKVDDSGLIYRAAYVVFYLRRDLRPVAWGKPKGSHGTPRARKAD
jgi:ubiquitin C-terminal hydrolase